MIGIRTLFLCLGMTINYSLSGQVVIDLPLSKIDESISWDGEERKYHSSYWNTPVVSNVSKPTLAVYQADEPNGTAVIICPGGGLYALSIDSEGNDVAKWLNKRGFTAFVLKYRLVPTNGDATAEIAQDGANVLTKAGMILPLAVEDGLNAIRHVRENAGKYQVDPQKIGIIGFSAGGAVTMGVTYAYDKLSRPDFIGPIYAWMDVVGEKEPPSDAPPLFALCASDDPLQLAPASVKLYSDWLAKEIPAELHMYSKGGHGFGMRKQNLPTDFWINRFSDWLTAQGFTKE